MMKPGEKGKRGKGEKGKTQNPPLISARTVKAALRELGQVHLSGVAEFVKVQTYEDQKKVRQVLVGLVKSGQVEYHGEGIYHLNDKSGARGSVQAKLWEFACLRFATAKPFTAAEAARLAECDRDYTKRYCRWLWNSGYLAIVSRGRAGAILYQVVGGKEHEPAPAWNRRAEKRKKKPEGPQAGTPAPLEAGAAGLVVEQCTGLARDELQKFAANMQQAFADFSRGMYQTMARHFPQVNRILLKMEADLAKIGKEQSHGEPADGGSAESQ